MSRPPSRDEIAERMSRLRRDAPVLWRRLPGLAEYEKTRYLMRRTAAAIAAGEASEQVWLLEHPPLYTAGTSAAAADVLAGARLPVHRVGRGGRVTYHGPGQRVAYLMLDLRQRGRDVRAFVAALEQWVIDALGDLGVAAFRREDRVGVWVERDTANVAQPAEEAKIAAIGVRVSRWVSRHGVAINVDPDLSHYEGIVPCGIRDHGITSLADLGITADMSPLDEALRRHFVRLFGPVREADGSEVSAAPMEEGEG